MVPKAVIQRVFFLLYNTSTATGFTMERGDRQYLVTARHTFIPDDSIAHPPVAQGTSISVSYFRNNGWTQLTVPIYFHANLKVDIAVFRLDNDLSPRHEVHFNGEKAYMSQQAFFLGFPFNLTGWGADANNGYPIPFVKAATMSAMGHDSDNHRIYYLDGHNNPGFSGGPLTFKSLDDNRYYVGAVMRGYKTQINDLNTPQGVLRFYENSGIAVGYDIKYAFEIIDAMPS